MHRKRMFDPARAAMLSLAMAAVATSFHEGIAQDSTAGQSRDSAGIRIVENVRPADDSRLPWGIGPEPTVSIGAVVGDEAYLLHRVSDAVVLPDGRIVVANSGTNELRVFDGAGVHLATWGREGEGPGEFMDLTGVDTWPGDSLVAWDSRSRSISVLGAGGMFGRSFVLEAGARPAPAPRGATRSRRDRPLELRVVLDDGSILGRIGEVTGEGYRRSRETYLLRRADTASPVEFGTHPGQESYLAFMNGMPVLGNLPFGRSLWEAEWGELVVITPDDEYEIRAYERTTGALARIVRREYDNRPPTREEVDEALDAALERAGLTGQRLEMARQGYGDMPLVERFPAFRMLLTDPLDHLWVREATLPGIDRPAPLWTVFDPEGRALGFIETPDGLTVFEIGADYLLGRMRDDVGVESVQVWALER
ncbi:MAG: 6-bladed beta-propeller [Gemmatimonadetes bacterium]|nr:6-bladed beta-propeller [Gemmatimonadota bacterium]